MSDGPVCPDCQGPVSFISRHVVGLDRAQEVLLCCNPDCGTTQITVITNA